MFAIISNKGDQYKVYEGKEYNLDLGKTDFVEKDKVNFSDVLMVSDEKKISVGTPTLSNASVEAEVIESGLDEKVSALKFHSKKRYQRNLGHRQPYTRVRILKINLKNEK